MHAGLEQDTAVEQAKEAVDMLHELLNPVGLVTPNHSNITRYILNGLYKIPSDVLAAKHASALMS